MAAARLPDSCRNPAKSATALITGTPAVSNETPDSKGAKTVATHALAMQPDPVMFSCQWLPFSIAKTSRPSEM